MHIAKKVFKFLYHFKRDIQVLSVQNKKYSNFFTIEKPIYSKIMQP